MTMNPAGHPAETFQMLGPCEGFPRGPPGAPHPYTVVNLPDDPPKDYFVWSICNVFYYNMCCLGLAALIYSVKVSFSGFCCESSLQIIRSHLFGDFKKGGLANGFHHFSFQARDRKMMGDMNGAQHYGSTARCLNIIATVLASLFVIIGIIIIIVSVSQIQQAMTYG